MLSCCDVSKYSMCLKKRHPDLSQGGHAGLPDGDGNGGEEEYNSFIIIGSDYEKKTNVIWF